MLAMAAIEASAASCAHCGTQVVAIKKCSICKQVGYCGAECQKAGWKGHKKACEPPLPLLEVARKLAVADDANDWRAVLKLEGRMEELMHCPAFITEGMADACCEKTLSIFVNAHVMAKRSTRMGASDHAFSLIRLERRRVEFLGKLERFRFFNNG